MMKNLWVQKPYALATWLADIGPFADSPEAVHGLLLKVAALGVEHSVAIVNVSELHGALAVAWDRRETVPCNIIETLAPRACLSWFGRDGEVVTAEVGDLGALLRTLEPTAGSISERNTDSNAPVVVSGSRLDYAGGHLSRRIDQQLLSFTTHSDIWFPFVTGDAHPSWDGERYFDNRDLANRHTPRLNAFLDEVARAIETAGGRWSIEHECVARNLAPWVTERGIRLDGPVPPLMPPELVDVPWPALDDA